MESEIHIHTSTDNDLFALDQRLETLIKVSIAIGKRNGVIGRQGEQNKSDKGEQDVTNKGDLRGYQAAPAGQDSTGFPA